MKEVYIIAAQRTPTGGFLGQLSDLSATELGSIAISSALEKAHVPLQVIDSVYMGNVLSAGLGQSPARQAALKAGISEHTDCTTVNKVCAAGMKAVMLGAQQIQLGMEDLVVAGGMENMSQAPHYARLRKPLKLGDSNLTDSLALDGLTDVYHQQHMGVLAEQCSTRFSLTREIQDQFALESYRKAALATQLGKFSNEIAPVTLSLKSGEVRIDSDEDVAKVIPEKVPLLPPAFVTGGTITAANASNLNDGAAALVLASAEAVAAHNLHPIARIVSYADAALAPEWFTLAPAEAMRKALERSQLTVSDLDFFEINEAYSAVVLANQQQLGILPEKVNLYGGAVAIGHPLGASGARILCTLLSVLRQEGGRYGMAAICNGGGGASAMIIEALPE